MEKPFVLVADDNEATCTLITAILRNDFVVDVSTDGRETIEKLKNRQYAAILLDLFMPGVDGYGVLDHLAAEHPDLLRRVLVITARVTPKDMERARGYGVCGIMVKPFDVEALLAAVRDCAGHDDAGFIGTPLLSSGMILLLADLLRRVP